MNQKLITSARVVLGALFFFFGLNGFFMWVTPPPMPPEAGNFMMALGATGYFFPFLKVCETLCGAALLSGCFAPLALLVLAPIIINIVLFHLFLAPAGALLAVVAAVLWVVVVIGNWNHFNHLFSKKA